MANWSDRCPVAKASAQLPPIRILDTAMATAPVRIRARAGRLLRGPFQNSSARPRATARSAAASRMM